MPKRKTPKPPNVTSTAFTISIAIKISSQDNILRKKRKEDFFKHNDYTIRPHDMANAGGEKKRDKAMFRKKESFA